MRTKSIAAETSQLAPFIIITTICCTTNGSIVWVTGDGVAEAPLSGVLITGTANFNTDIVSLSGYAGLGPIGFSE